MDSSISLRDITNRTLNPVVDDSPTKTFNALLNSTFNLDEMKENYCPGDSLPEFTQESTQLAVDEGLSYYDSSLPSPQSPVSYEEMKAWLATPKPKPKPKRSRVIEASPPSSDIESDSDAVASPATSALSSPVSVSFSCSSQPSSPGCDYDSDPDVPTLETSQSASQASSDTGALSDEYYALLRLLRKDGAVKLLSTWRQYYALSPREKMHLLIQIDQDDYSESEITGRAVYNDAMLDKLRRALKDGTLKNNLFLHHLIEDATIIKYEEDFGDTFENHDWLTTTAYYGPSHYLTSSRDTKLSFRLDVDFTGFVAETLEFFLSSWEMVISPNYNVRLQSCKMRYKGKSLHNCTNIGVGFVNGNIPVFAVFPDCPLEESNEVITTFFERCAYQGVLDSGQARTTPIALPFKEVSENRTPGETTRILPETTSCIQRRIEELIEADPRCKPVFVIQHYGRKDPVSSADDIVKLSDELNKIFDMGKVYHHTPGNAVYFMQDIGLDIGCGDDSNVTTFFTRNLTGLLADVRNSPLKALMVRNSTIFEHARSKNYDEDYAKPKITEYPNFGIGTCASMMIEYNKQHVLLGRVKAYHKGSEDYRHHIPFAKSYHAALAFPVEKVKQLIGNDVRVSDKLRTRLNQEVNDVNTRKELKRSQKLYSTIMPQKAYGPRLEITLQNPTGQQLLDAYMEMAMLGESLTELFNMLKALYQCGLIPLEMMRCSPLQTVLTETICLFPQKFTDSIASYFYLLLDYVVRARHLDALDYSDDLLRAAFLLQDCLTFIWSGAVLQLAHPKLFNRYKLKEHVFTYGRLHFEPHLVDFTYEFNEVKCLLPLDDAAREAEEADVVDMEDSDFILALPPKFLYSLFPHHASDKESMMDISARIRLCLRPCDGFVTPQDRLITSTIAANLVNGLLLALCNAAGFHDRAQKAAFIDALCRGRDAIFTLLAAAHPGCMLKLKETVTMESVCETAFPSDATRSFKRYPIALEYFTHWRLAQKKVVAQLNNNLKVGKTKALQTLQNLSNKNIARPAITVGGLKRKMVRLLESVGFRYFPCISNDSFWTKPGQTVFKFVRISRTAAPSSVMSVGDGGQPISLTSDSVLDLEAKIKLIDYIIRQSQLVQKCKNKTELRAVCIFHLTKTKPEATMKYHGIKVEDVLDTQLFTQEGKRAPILPVDEGIWLAKYRHYFG